MIVFKELVSLIAAPIGQKDGEVLVNVDILYKLLECIMNRLLLNNTINVDINLISFNKEQYTIYSKGIQLFTYFVNIIR